MKAMDSDGALKLLSETKTPKALKPVKNIVKKSQNPNSANAGEAKVVSVSQKKSAMTEEVKATLQAQGEIKNDNREAQDDNKDKNVIENKEKQIDEKNEVEGPVDQNTRVLLLKKSDNDHNGNNGKAIVIEGTKETSQSDQNNKGKSQMDQDNKEKNQVDEKKEEQVPIGHKNNAQLGGLILMCNERTRPDCLRYMVMGLPAYRQGYIMRVKPGLKLFLYDFDLKLLYGIYEAASPGGMKLEPAAFNGAFPAQVRFKVYKDCMPLPLSVFKDAIIENDNGNMFKTELTFQQVHKLSELFHPVILHPNAHPAPIPVHVPPVLHPLRGPIVPPVGIPENRREAPPHTQHGLSSGQPYLIHPNARPAHIPVHVPPVFHPLRGPIALPVGIPENRREAPPHTQQGLSPGQPYLPHTNAHPAPIPVHVPLFHPLPGPSTMGIPENRREAPPHTQQGLSSGQPYLPHPNAHPLPGPGTVGIPENIREAPPHTQQGLSSGQPYLPHPNAHPLPGPGTVGIPENRREAPPLAQQGPSSKQPYLPHPNAHPAPIPAHVPPVFHPPPGPSTVGIPENRREEPPHTQQGPSSRQPYLHNERRYEDPWQGIPENRREASPHTLQGLSSGQPYLLNNERRYEVPPQGSDREQLPKYASSKQREFEREQLPEYSASKQREYEREQLPEYPASKQREYEWGQLAKYLSSKQRDSVPENRETDPHDPLALSEREYQYFGLGREPPPPTSAHSPAATTTLSASLDPYRSSRDPHLYSGSSSSSYPRTSLHPYSLLSRRDTDPIDSDLHRRRGASQDAPPISTAAHLGHSYGIPRKAEIEYGGRIFVARTDEAEKVHTAHDADSPSDYSRRHQHQGGGPDVASLPVSTRYSFAVIFMTGRWQKHSLTTTGQFQ
ncbi:Development/cell death domain-containing protein [Cinnamomum micranthum f. kanehirae]|uniref:Development/cell death domain-containing protein n=1 Tax=Cinnamomum micranthum f. kanehirae TaxID=337451 RepID=A0A3S3Q0Y2_9MAGN|nr:Development/cell death domain-containing protein [Cinnamomum micranthum f. kanehirae]